ncbi:hypothetical protein BDV19DRAFT_378800 [Aspergillus venezuelensis]
MIVAAVLIGALPLSWAQQFAGTQMFTAYLGLTASCQESLATNVTCPPYLGVLSERYAVQEACIDDCYTSLQNAGAVIAEACTATTDVIVVDNVAYPATFIVDNYLFTYRLSFQETDDCNSVAQALNVSTYSLLYSNNLDLYCRNFDSAVGSTLVVGSLSNVTIPQFLAWNPNFNPLCQNAVNYIGYVVCISLVSLANGLSLMDFYFLNPEIDDDCTNLLLGEAYCVAPVGDISTYSNYPVTTPLFTVPLATFSSVDTQISTSTSGSERTYTPTAMPLAEGTLEDCEQYQDYDPDYPEFNCCTRVARSMDVTTDQLLEWNPSLSSDMSTCALQPGYRYCKIQDYASSPSWDGCLPINATESTTVSNCNCFTPTYGYMEGQQLQTWNPWLAGDCDTALYANLGRSDMRAVAITTSTLITATPAAPTQAGIVAGCQKYHTIASGEDCSTFGKTCTNLWLGYAYCVEGPSATTTAKTTTSTAGPVPAQTQTGIVSDCNKYYTVISGDFCAKIEGDYGITFAQLYEWDPAIGSNCESLWVGYAVCVGVSCFFCG